MLNLTLNKDIFQGRIGTSKILISSMLTTVATEVYKILRLFRT